MENVLVKNLVYNFGFSLTTYTNEPIRNIFFTCSECNSPFVSILNKDSKFIGNLWISDVKAVYAPNEEYTVEEFVTKNPDLLEKEHILKTSDSINLKTIKFKHHIVPIIDDKEIIVGYFDEIKNSSSTYIHNHDVFELTIDNFSILIVDDENELTKVLSSYLTGKEITCYCASNGEEALELIKQNQSINLILTDIKMPIMSGLELLKKVRSFNHDIPVIVLTGNGNKQEAVESIRNGANDFLDKPVDLEVLYKTIQNQIKIIQAKHQEVLNQKTQSLLAHTGMLMSRSDINISGKMKIFCEKLSEMLGCKNVSVIMYNEKINKLHIKGSTNKDLRERELSLNDAPVLKYVLDNKLSLITKSLVDFEKFHIVDKEGSYQTGTALVIPLNRNGEIQGFITASDKLFNCSFAKQDYELLQSIITTIPVMFDYAGILTKYENLNRDLKYKAESMANGLMEVEKEKEQYLKLALLGEMSGSIAHEIKNPLTVAMAYSKKLKTLLELDEKSEKAVEKLSICLDRINKITNSISRMSRMDQQEISGFQLSEAIKSCLLLLEERMNKHAIDLKLEIDEDITLAGNQIQIEQVISNLISNAVDALNDQEERIIIIRARKENKDHAIIEVNDNGPGFSKEVGQNIFNKFFTTKDVGKGTGLGLHISKTIIEGHGGSISHGRNSGLTSFSLLLPLSKS